jgi:SulP family sulfate permease
MSSRWLAPTLREYRAAWIGADALAGLTLVAVALPSQMATARLANLPAALGLYAFIAGSLLYALLGTNHQLSVGADSTIAPILATGVAAVAVVGTTGYVTLIAFTSLIVGAILVAVGLLRLGWISELLSTPVITGVLAGIAVEIIARQLPVVLGLPGGGSTTIDRVRRVIDEFAHVNGWSVGIALGVLTIIVGAQHLDRRIPGPLIGVACSIIMVDALGLATHHDVAVLGLVHGGLPHLRVPTASWLQFRKLIGTVLTVAFVCIAQTAATVRNSAGADSDDFNRDLISIGTGSLAAGFIGTIAVDASPPNTVIVSASGARSQLTNIVAAGIALIVIVFATAPLAHLPDAALGATLIFIATKLFRVRELRSILHFDRIEFLLATASLLAVALVGIEQGVALAMILSLADRARRVARPRDAVLGRDPGTDHWIPTDIGRPTEQVPGVLVYLFYAPLWYGNADYFRLHVRRLVDTASEPLRLVVLDADAVSDIDYTGLEALRCLASDLRERGVTIAIARASHLVHHDLKRGALLEQFGPEQLFTSVEQAVTHSPG